MQKILILILAMLIINCAGTKPFVFVKDNIWMLSVENANSILMFKFENAIEKEIKFDNNYLRIMLNDGLWNLSVFIEKCEECNNAIECRNMIKNRNLNNPEFEIINVKENSNDSTAELEYIIKAFKGINTNQKNYYKEFVKNGFWWDMHLSKMTYEENDSMMAKSIMNKSILVDKRRDK
jgi:hypothetical protein